MAPTTPGTTKPGLAVRARRRRVVSGQEAMVGSVGEMMDDVEDHGQARIHGEIWNVQVDSPLKKGDHVKVVKVDGLMLTVESVK